VKREGGEAIKKFFASVRCTLHLPSKRLQGLLPKLQETSGLEGNKEKNPFELDRLPSSSVKAPLSSVTALKTTGSNPGLWPPSASSKNPPPENSCRKENRKINRKPETRAFRTPSVDQAKIPTEASSSDESFSGPEKQNQNVLLRVIPGCTGQI